MNGRWCGVSTPWLGISSRVAPSSGLHHNTHESDGNGGNSRNEPHRQPFFSQCNIYPLLRVREYYKNTRCLMKTTDNSSHLCNRDQSFINNDTLPPNQLSPWSPEPTKAHFSSKSKYTSMHSRPRSNRAGTTRVAITFIRSGGRNGVDTRDDLYVPRVDVATRVWPAIFSRSASSRRTRAWPHNVEKEHSHRNIKLARSTQRRELWERQCRDSINNDLSI